MTKPQPRPTADHALSILAPLMIGLHVDSPHLNLANVVMAAVRPRVPVSIVQLNLVLQGERSYKPIPHRRELIVSADGAKLTEKHKPGYFRLCDGRSHEQTSQAWDRWRWEISWTWHASGADVGLNTPYGVTLAVEQYRLFEGKIECAAQLALVRHLFVDGLRAIDEHAEVIGRHDWDDAWWQLETPAATS